MLDNSLTDEDEIWSNSDVLQKESEVSEDGICDLRGRFMIGGNENKTRVSKQKETVNIAGTNNEVGGLREFDTHMAY